MHRSHNLPICFFVNSIYVNGPHSLLSLCEKVLVANKLGGREYILIKCVLSMNYDDELAEINPVREIPVIFHGDLRLFER